MSPTGILAQQNTRLRIGASKNAVFVGILLFTAIMLIASGCRGRVTSLRSAMHVPPARPAEPRSSGRLPPDRFLAPSNHRDWIASQKVLPYATIKDDEVKVHNIRNCDYVTEHDVIVHHYDKKFDLKKIESVDFIVVPFTEGSALAHTMLSFGFGKGEYLVSSVEARLEKGETYSPIGGAARQFELMYVLADERDVIRLRTEVRNAPVYVYRSTATPEQSRELLVDILERVNSLRKEPEFYDTLTNNCTTNIVRHVDRLFPGVIPTDYRVLLPGFSPQLAYELGLLDKSVPFEELRNKARVNELAHRYKDSADFSAKIRR